MVEDWDDMRERMQDHMDGGPYGPHMGGSTWWPLWMLLLLLLVVAVVAVVVLSTGRRHAGPPPELGQYAPPPGPGAAAGDAAETVLRERYARGEISEAEYDARLARLRASR
jgi:putative membrane protein